MTIKYDTGADMWSDYIATYGVVEARGICNRYLNMQVRNDNPEELQFCRELYAAMQATPLTEVERESVLAKLEKAKAASSERTRNHKSHASKYER